MIQNLARLLARLRFAPVLLAFSTTAFSQAELYLKASSHTGSSTGPASSSFGASLSLSGSTLVVGRVGEHSTATGINGDPIVTGFGSHNSGAAYVFMRSGPTWHQQAYVKASNADFGDRFGASVGISGDAMVITAPWEQSSAFGVDGDQADNSLMYPDSGAAYVFERNGTTWSQQAYLKRPHALVKNFGQAAAISGDTIVVGAADLICVFVRSGTTWSTQAILSGTFTEQGDSFGASVAIEGDTLVVGAPAEDSGAAGVNGNQQDNSNSSSGAAYVFQRTGTTWNQEAYLKSSVSGIENGFGTSVSSSGDTVVIGPRVHVFVRNGTSWSSEAEIATDPTNAPQGVAVSADMIAIGAPGDDNGVGCINGAETSTFSRGVGATYIYRRTGTTWNKTDYIKVPDADHDDWFGWSVVLEGNVLFACAPNEDSDATGVNGDQFNDGRSDSGAVFGFNLSMLPVPFPSICSGDGGDQLGCTNCPCMNNSPTGTIGGCLNSAGRSARLHACGDPSVSLPSGSNEDLRFMLTGGTSLAFCLLTSGASLAPVSMANPCFGQSSGAQAAAFDGLRCAVEATRRHGGRSSNWYGNVGVDGILSQFATVISTGRPWGGQDNPQAGIAQAGAGFIAGETRYFQVLHREDGLLSCMRGVNTSQAIEVTFTP